VKEKILYKVAKALKLVALTPAYSSVRREIRNMLPENTDNRTVFFLFSCWEKSYLPAVATNGETPSYLCSQHQKDNDVGHEFALNWLIFKMICIVHKYSGCTSWITQCVYIRKSSQYIVYR